MHVNVRLGSLTSSQASQYASEVMDLVELLRRPEGKTLEFKRDLSSPDGPLKSIVAFANTAAASC